MLLWVFVIRIAMAEQFNERKYGAIGQRYSLFLALAFLVVIGIVAVKVTPAPFWRMWLFWRDEASRSHVAWLVFSALIALVALTEVFAGLTAVLVQAGWFDTTTSFPDIQETDEGFLWRFDPGSYGAIELHYVWHFLDAIPALKVPDTLNWSEPTYFSDKWSGAFLLLYKLAVIVPVLAVAVSVYKRRSRE